MFYFGQHKNTLNLITISTEQKSLYLCNPFANGKACPEANALGLNLWGRLELTVGVMQV